jgi:serine/threonine-protein kinase
VGDPGGLRPGKQLVGGRYEIDELLGRGGMAEVHKGADLRLGRTVAVKRLRSDLASDPTFQARFRREAQSAASLNHSSIVAVYDTGEQQAYDGSELSLPYIVMEYVEGRTLRDILREGRRILPERALEITAAVLEALDYSHRAGIVHRDIKPANVMLTPAGDVKVMDFGIARAVSDSSATMTQTAAVLGTAQYLSPEQARGEQVDARSDIYSTGCVLFELLTGRPPFVGDSPLSVAYQHVREEPVAPSSLDPEIPPAVDAIVRKALAKSTSARYQSAAQMRADIERVLAGHEVAAPAVAAGPATQPFLPPPPVTDPLVATTVGAPVADDEPPRRRVWAYAVLGLVVLALFAAAAVFGRQLFSADAPPAETSVPELQGLTVAKASAKLKEQDLRRGRVTFEKSDTVREGLVISSSPAGGEFAEVGSRVRLVVSGGQRLVRVPSLQNGSLAEARAALEELGLRIKPIAQDSTEPKNQVISTDPAPGVPVEVNRVVTVYYSKGEIPMPSVVGLEKRAAVKLLRGRGFVPVVVKDPTSTVPAGRVIDQNPLAGELEPLGTRVVITVSDPAPTPTTPLPTTATSPSPTTTPTETSTPTSSPTLSPTSTTTTPEDD